MNKTYRILPGAEDMLLRLLRGLALSDEERALLRACALRHVEVSAEENTWELVIGTPAVLDEELIAAMARQVEENYGLAGAFVQQNVVALAPAIAPLWERVVREAAGEDAVLFHTLRQTAYAIDGNVIRLSAPGTFGAELFAQSAVAKRVEAAVRTHVGCACQVVCMECALGEMSAPDWTPPPMPAPVKRDALQRAQKPRKCPQALSSGAAYRVRRASSA